MCIGNMHEKPLTAQIRAIGIFFLENSRMRPVRHVEALAFRAFDHIAV